MNFCFKWTENLWVWIIKIIANILKIKNKYKKCAGCPQKAVFIFIEKLYKILTKTLKDVSTVSLILSKHFLFISILVPYYCV